MKEENQKIVFPEETIDIIAELIKKYKLEKIKEKIEEKIIQAKTLEKKKGLFENLPTCQISRIIKGVTEEKISIKEMVPTLQKRLNIPKKIAIELANDLEKKIINLIQKVPKEPTKIEPSAPPEKPPLPKKPDIYREPIE